MKQIKYLSFIPFLALLCLMTGCENDKDVYYPYVNVPLTTHNPVLVEEKSCISVLVWTV